MSPAKPAMVNRWKRGREPWRQIGKNRFAAIIHAGPDTTSNIVIHGYGQTETVQLTNLIFHSPELLEIAKKYCHLIKSEFEGRNGISSDMKGEYEHAMAIIAAAEAVS